MNAQLDFLVDAPRSRRTDPESSHAAAEAICGKLQADQERAWRAVRLWPGCTARELAHHIAGKFGGSEYALYDSLHKRLAELNGLKVKSAELRKCRHSGRMAQVWYPL